MRYLTAIALGLCLAVSAEAQQGDAKIDAALVRKIENQMVMPEGASELSAYDRFYVATQQSGRFVIKGLYLGTSSSFRGSARQRAVAVDGVPGAYAMKPGEHLPGILDGGCGVVEMTFDLKTQAPWIVRLGDKPSTPGVPEPTGYCHGLA